MVIMLLILGYDIGGICAHLMLDHRTYGKSPAFAELLTNIKLIGYQVFPFINNFNACFNIV